MLNDKGSNVGFDRVRFKCRVIQEKVTRRVQSQLTIRLELDIKQAPS